MKFGKQSFRLVILLMSLIYCNINNPYIFAEEWRFHPSFDRTPLRIVDTPDNTYFLVHQQIYKKNLTGYDFPSLTLFKFDKKDLQSGITPLVHDVALSSADIRLADYSPKGDYLIIVYNDGGVDLINKNNELTYVDKLKKYSVPGMDIVNSVTFEPSTGDAWVATDAGYMHINASSFTVEDIQVLGKAITAIGRFSNRIVALADNSAWMATTDKPVDFSEFSKIANITSPSVLMPLSENCFGYIQGAPGTTRPLMSATYSGDAWKTKQLGSDNFYSLVANESLVSRYESNFIPNRDGFLCFSSSKAWQLKAPADGEEASAFSITLDQSPLTLGSWDFNNFWAYRDRGTFVPRHAAYSAENSAASATWTDTSDPIRPNAPAAFICTHMSYSPTYGMLAMNHGHEQIFRGNDSMVNPPLLSILADNKWFLASHAYQIPSSIEANSLWMSIYRNNINRYPLPDPKGVLIDPCNPNWIISGSMFGGIMFQDMSDIKKDVIRFGAENDTFLGFPGFVPATPKKSWGTLSCFSPPTADENGTIWALFSNAYTNRRLHLKYMTSEVRKKIYESSLEDLDKIDNWKTIEFSYPGVVYWCCKVLALCHSRNKNKLVLCPADYSSPIIIFNHNGTLDDTTDDQEHELHYVSVNSGEEYSLNDIVDLIENPVTGEVIVWVGDMAMCFYPDSEISGSTIKGRLLTDSIKKGKLGRTSQINKIIFDSDNNIWLATNNEGVIGISADGKDIFAKYNIENSLIPSNVVYGLCWNKGNHSLVISTQKGIAEVFPNINSLSASPSVPYVVPEVVTPDYNGNIQIRNLPVNVEILIKDNKGTILRNLGISNGKFKEWDMKDNLNNRVKSGRYFVSINGYDSIEVSVMQN